MRNTAITSSAAALIPSMAELSKIGDRHSSDSEPVGLNDSERAMSIDDGSRSNQLSGMVSRRAALTLQGHESREPETNRLHHSPSVLTLVQFPGIPVNFAAGNQPLRWFNPELSFAKVPS